MAQVIPALPWWGAIQLWWGLRVAATTWRTAGARVRNSPGHPGPGLHGAAMATGDWEQTKTHNFVHLDPDPALQHSLWLTGFVSGSINPTAFAETRLQNGHSVVACELMSSITIRQLRN